MSKNNKPLTTEEFICRSNKTHNHKYDYSESIYISSKYKAIIICPIHGKFEQNVKDHMAGQGCRSCKYSNIKSRKSLPEFINSANYIHDNKYDYSNVIYKTNSTPIEIICKEHGSFLQRPSHHLNGCGCKNVSMKFLPI